MAVKPLEAKQRKSLRRHVADRLLRRSNRQSDIGVHGPIPEWPAVGFFATSNRARDADELGAHFVDRQSDLCITVAAEIDELEVRSEIRVGKRPGGFQVEALCIFEVREGLKRVSPQNGKR